MKKFLFLGSFLLLFISFSYGYEEKGIASWYGGKYQGRKTASGEIFDAKKLTAAHKDLPFGTIVTVTNIQTGQSVKVRINDRGPYAKGRIIDLSEAAAAQIGLLKQGTGAVTLSADPKVAEMISYCSIQVASYRNLNNAARLKKQLSEAGFTPYAVMTSDGVIRIELKNVPKDEADKVVAQLKKMGINDPLVKV